MARQPYADARLWTADRGPVAHLPTPLLYGLVHPEPLTMLHSNNFRVDHNVGLVGFSILKSGRMIIALNSLKLRSGLNGAGRSIYTGSGCAQDIHA